MCIRDRIKSDPTDASAPFNLGNMLRAHARNIEAEAAFRSATRTDPTFAAAWYNLADLLDDQGRTDSAIECLRKALRAAPDYADAMFNLALLLQRKNQYPGLPITGAAISPAIVVQIGRREPAGH